MSGKNEKFTLQQLPRLIIPVALLLFLVGQAQLGSAFIAQSTEPPPPPPPEHTEPPGSEAGTLCGKLVFLEDAQSGAKDIGLRNCTTSEVYVFEQHPAELFNNYTFFGVKIQNGPDFNDINYGRLRKYIVSFTSYFQIQNCNFCGQPFTPIETPGPVLATTEPPVETAPVLPETEVVQVPDLQGPPIDPIVSSECISYTSQLIGTAMGFTKFQFLFDKGPEILAEAPGADVCGDDPFCLKTVRLKTLYRGMIETSFEISPGVRQVAPVISAIVKLFDDPQAETACTLPATAAWEIAIQFSAKGTPVDAFAVFSPANIRVRDFERKAAGFESDGRIVQDIPLSLVRTKGEAKYIFLPGKVVSEVEIEGTGEGVMTVEAARNTESVVQNIGYDQVPVDAATKGNLDLGKSTPTLEITASSSGQTASIAPTRFEEFQIVPSVAPLTATPTVTETPTLTPTPAGFSLPGDAQLWIGLILIAGVVAFLVVLGIGLIYMFSIRGRRS